MVTSNRTFAETIRRSAEADFSHKRMLSSSGEYARVKLRLVPLDSGAGLEFVNGDATESIPKKWIASVERGVLEAAKAGILNNGPVIDCCVTFCGGAYHDTDSNDRAFFAAAQKAFWQAMRKAEPELVRPSLRVVSFNGDTHDQ